MVYEKIFIGDHSMNYGERLKILREQSNLKIHDISKLLGFEKDTYGKYEREYTTIPIFHLNTLCNFYHVSLDYIFNLTDIKIYANEREDIDLSISGIRLKEFRKEHKFTQSDLAKVLGCSYGTIAGYERGRYPIATPFLYIISKQFHISADYLLGKIDNPKYF